MITEDYVSFETAKLLKEKEFDKAVLITDWWYNAEGQAYKRGNYSYGGAPFYDKKTCFNCPTLQMAMKWLREEHKIFISISFQYDKFKQPYYFYKIANIGKNEDWNIEHLEHITVEQACEAAIKYCLKNLI